MEIGGGEGDGNDGCRERCCLKEVNEAVRPIFERMVQSHDDDVEILEESDTSSADEHVIACLTAEEAERARCEDIFRQVLKTLGEDVGRQGILQTPARYVKAVAEMLKGYESTAEAALGDAVFPEECVYRSNQTVCVGSIDFFSTDARTLLPFFGEVHVSYQPGGGRVAGLSKFARITEVFAKRLQTPRGLAQEIANAVERLLDPKGVLVVVSCVHLKETSVSGLGPSSSNLSLPIPGAPGASTHVEARGTYLHREGRDAREMLALIDLRNLGIDGGHPGGVARCFTAVLDGLLCAEGALSEEGARLQRQREDTVKNLIYRMHAQSPKSGKFPSELLWNAASSYARWLLVMTSGACFSMDYVLRVVRALPGEAKADPGTAVEEGGGVVFRRGLLAGSVKDRQTCELFTPVGTVCEHHILPFFGKVYLCLLAKEGGEVEATSAELQAIVWKYSRQLQLQERLVAQIADAVEENFPRLDGVFVCMSAYHHCMRARGAEKTSAKTLSVVKRGAFEDDHGASMECVDRYREMAREKA